jgi:hypothetical protein
MFYPFCLRKDLVLIALLLLLGTATSSLRAQDDDDKFLDPPERKYKITGKASELLRDDAQLRRLSGELITNLNEDLKTYPEYAKVLFQVNYLHLLALHASRDEYEKTSDTILKLRALDESVAAKQIALFEEAWVKAKQESNNGSDAEFRKSFERHFAAAFGRFEYKDIAEVAQAIKSRLAVANTELFYGTFEASVQPILDRSAGLVEQDIAVSIVGMKFYGEQFLPLKDEMMRVLTALQNANVVTTDRTEIWSARSATLSLAEVKRPVIVAVWDAGVDVQALPIANRFVNPQELKLDGIDNDGNGFVDDLYGIGYDLNEMASSGRVLDDPTGKVKSDVKRLQGLTKGTLDLQAGIESREAADLQAIMASLKREQALDFSEELSFYTQHAHGTHVAGIVIDGNPAAKILTTRVTYDHRMQQQPYTAEMAEFKAQMYREIVAYYKRQGVRVVNMSWRYNKMPIYVSLKTNGIGKDESERFKLAQKYFEIEKQALYEAIKSAPEILFVAAAGNEGQDVNSEQYIPASFDLPNLITIGAVDSTGKKTSFSNTGKSVDFFANGFEIDSVVPGGDRIKLSGTSMASPQVANLAVKLLAVKPALTPTQVVSLIRRGSRPSELEPKLLLIDPRRSLALARR